MSIEERERKIAELQREMARLMAENKKEEEEIKEAQAKERKARGLPPIRFPREGYINWNSSSSDSYKYVIKFMERQGVSQTYGLYSGYEIVTDCGTHFKIFREPTHLKSTEIIFNNGRRTFVKQVICEGSTDYAEIVFNTNNHRYRIEVTEENGWMFYPEGDDENGEQIVEVKNIEDPIRFPEGDSDSSDEEYDRHEEIFITHEKKFQF